RFVERDLAIAALPAETAVAGHDQAFGRDTLQSFANLASHIFRPVRLQRAMTYGADADLLLQIVLERLEQLQILLIAVFHLERPDIAAAPLQVNLDGIGVARVLHHPLHVWVSPAGVDP